MTNREKKHKKQGRILLLYGGWKGHSPKKFADFTCQNLLSNYDVVSTSDLRMLCRKVLSDFDLILPIWTFGKITEKQEKGLFEAVADGLGYVGWHGNASSFMGSRMHKFLLGGQLVGHPGGNEIKYPVHFLNNDPLVEGLKNITVKSEQYYLLIDPSVKVLATTPIVGDNMYWLKGVKMPMAWKRKWGSGRVFYCALGHTVDELKHLSVITLLSRSIKWACRNSKEKY